ncbi:MAG TPA: hypothetical protein VKP89_09695 [Burkholderiales bacterium]|nr:hypothetical protein [Burkholderiales bacterium]
MKATLLVVLLVAAVAALASLLDRARPDAPAPDAQSEHVDRTDVPWQAPDVDPDNLRGF